MLEVVGVSHRYGRRSALSDVSLRLGPGVSGLIGENGAGKTTFLRLCAGMLRVQTGTISVDGTALGGLSRRRGRGQVAFMPQAAALPRSFTAVEFVTYLTWMRGVESRQARRQARDALGQVGLGSRADDKVGRLSGGMQRRVWLAQALAAQPAVLLLDEPSTGLDPRQRAAMVEVLSQLDPTMTVVLSSHVLEDVADLATRTVAIAQGRITYDGPTPDVLDAAAFMSLTDRTDSAVA